MSKWKPTIVVTVVLSVAVGAVALADKLSDFKDAVTKEGCESIPYSDLKSTCNAEQPQVHPHCDGSKGPVTCGDESITPQLKVALVREQMHLAELQAKKNRLESDRSSSTDEAERERLASEIEQVSSEIEAAESRIEQAEAELLARKELVEKAIETIGKCIDYRRAVMNVFASALDKVRNEDETPEIQDLARQLRAKWEAQKPGHEQAITDKNNALESCKKSRP